VKIAALYARVSTSNQEKEETILSQISEIEDKVKQDGNFIDEKLKFLDEGWSGELLARPALDELRDVIKNKNIEVLYVYDLGRLSRNFMNQLILKNEIQEAGIQLISLHDINAENPEQMFAQNVMGLFHEYERIKITERMRRGKLYKSKKGILFGWNAPYGYKYVKGDDHQLGRFEVVEAEAKAVKMMFETIAIEGSTIRQLSKKLFQLKIRAREQKDGIWTTGVLCRRLRDTTYIGKHYYNKTESIVSQAPTKEGTYKRLKKSSRKMKAIEDWHPIEVPAIINNDLFEAAQKQLVLNSQLAIRNRKHDYLLSGLLSCTCGCTRAGEGGNQAGQFYYRCTDRVRRYPLPKVCDKAGVNASVIDDQIWNTISELLTNPELVKKQAEQWLSKQQSKHISEQIDKHKLGKDLAKITEEEKRYLKAFGEGVISFEQYKEQASEIKLKKAQITSKLSTSNNESIPSQAYELPDLEELCGKISRVLKKATFEKKQFIIRRTIQRVITDSKTATIKGYIPLSIANLEENQKYEFSSINRHRRPA
jgi:site-specific DNA recombinase